MATLLTWTPIIASTDFDGIKTDLGTLGAGILAVTLIIFGVLVIIRVMAH